MKSKETEMAIKGLSSLKLCNSTAIMDLYHKFITNLPGDICPFS